MELNWTAVRIQMETGRRDARAGLVCAASTAARLADVVRRLGQSEQNPWFVGLIVRLLAGIARRDRIACDIIRFRTSRRATFARHFIATGSRLLRNIGKPARGGNVRSFGNICRRSRVDQLR